MGEQTGEDGTIGVGESGLAGPALQDQQLVPQSKDLDVLVTVTHRQQTKEREAARQIMMPSAPRVDEDIGPSGRRAPGASDQVRDLCGLIGTRSVRQGTRARRWHGTVEPGWPTDRARLPHLKQGGPTAPHGSLPRTGSSPVITWTANARRPRASDPVRRQMARYQASARSCVQADPRGISVILLQVHTQLGWMY